MTSPASPLLPGTDWGSAPDRYLAICARGLECVAAEELRQLGAVEVTEVIGGVRFEGSPTVLYRACLRMRTVSRIVRTLREFAAQSAQMLYSQVRRVAWERILTLETTFSVHATLQGQGARTRQIDPSAQGANRGRKPDPRASRDRSGDRAAGRNRDRNPERGAEQGINHSQFAALKIKDAIVDRMRNETGGRPNVDTHSPCVRIHAHFAEGRCTLSIDATGGSLHQRGYRVVTTEAPLKETLAAALVDFSGWDGIQPLYDPMCGSGTLVIEAALKALRIAPGLQHTNYGCRYWPDYHPEEWQRVLAETESMKIDPRTGTPLPRIWASDINPTAVEAARENAKQAGVADVIHFFRSRIEDSLPPVHEPGILLMNPPYGARLGNNAEVIELYRHVTRVWSTRFKGWKANAFVGNLTLARHLNLPVIGKRRLYNGPLECRLLEFQL